MRKRRREPAAWRRAGLLLAVLSFSLTVDASSKGRRRKKHPDAATKSAPTLSPGKAPSSAPAPAPTPAPRVESALLVVYPDERFDYLLGLKDMGNGRVQLMLANGIKTEISIANIMEIKYEEITLRPENLPVPKTENDALPPFVVPPALDRLIRAAALKAGLDYKLVVSLIKAESNFNPVALSRKGAQGLMQLIPATARRFGVAHPFIPAENLDGGCAYLKFLLSHYPGNLDHAIAAYNAGEGAVDRHAGIPPFRETQDYVKRINGYMNSFRPTLSPAPPPGMTAKP